MVTLESSVAQLIALGCLLAALVFAVLLIGFGWWLTRRVLGLAARFKSVGAERTAGGQIQMKGLFDGAPEPMNALTATEYARLDSERTHQIAAGFKDDLSKKFGSVEHSNGQPLGSHTSSKLPPS